MALLTNLIAPNFTRFDFVSNIYNYNENSDRVLRKLESYGCKIQLAHFAIESTLRAFNGNCPDFLDSTDSTVASVKDLVSLYINDKICVDLHCKGDLIVGSNPMAEYVKNKIVAEAKKLEYLRWFGDKAATPTADPIDGYITLIKASSTVNTIPSMSSALITSPTTVIAELNKIYAAAYPLLGSEMEIIISPAVWAALLQAVSATPNNVLFTIEGNGVGTFLGVKLTVIDALGFGSSATAGIAIAGIFGQRPDAQLIWYTDASDAKLDPKISDFKIIPLGEAYRDQYVLQAYMNVLPLVVNEDKLVAYY